MPHTTWPPKANNAVNVYPCNNSNNDFDYEQTFNKKYKPLNQHSMPTLFIFIKIIIIKTLIVSHGHLNLALHHCKKWCNSHLNNINSFTNTQSLSRDTSQVVHKEFPLTNLNTLKFRPKALNPNREKTQVLTHP